LKEVQVFIDDRRPTHAGLPLLKSVEMVEVDVINKAGSHTPDEWCVGANELLSKLQASNAAIEGKYTCHWQPEQHF
jgi:hypothetical protein